MSVKAKFTCTSITKCRHWDGSGRFLFTARMTPVVTGSDENKAFFDATPSGSVELGTFKEDHFEPGKEYYLTFDEVN